MTATIASVSAPAAAGGGSAAPSSTAPVQTSAGTEAKASGAPVHPNDAAKAPPKDGGAPKETPKEAAARRFKAKAKFDGKEQEIDLGEDEVVREIQKSRHYERTRGEFEKQKSQFEETLKSLEADPIAFLKQRKIDLQQLAAADVAREGELAKLSPEQRRIAELEQQLEGHKTAEQKRVEAEKAQAEQREHQELVQSTVRTIDSAIKLSGRARSGELVKVFAEVMELAEHAGEPPLSPEQLVAAGERLETKRLTAGLKRAATDPAWRGRNAAVMKELAQAILPALDGPELIEFVGRDIAVKLGKAQLAQFKKNPLPQVANLGEQPQQTQKPALKVDEPQSMYTMLDKLAGA